MTKGTGLLSVLTFSEYRKEALFLLREGPLTLSEIKDYFHVTNSEIHPRLKEMVKAGILDKNGNHYVLNALGKSLATKLEPLLNSISAIEANEDFWKCHDLSGIPEHLLDRISELADCRTIEEEQSYVYDTHRAFVKNVLVSKHFEGITTVFFTYWIDMFLELARRKVNISIIVTEDVLARIRNEYNEELEEGISYPNAHFYVIKKSPKIAFAVTDRFFSLSLYSKNGVYDPRKDLMGYDKSSKNWGRELFKCCLEHAVEVKNSQPMNEYICENANINPTVIIDSPSTKTALTHF